MTQHYTHKPTLKYSKLRMSADGILQFYVIENNESGNADVIRLNLSRLGMNAFFDELGQNIDTTKQTGSHTLDSLRLDLEGKKGGNKSIPNHVSGLHVCSKISVLSEHHEKHPMEFTYMWGYGYKSLRRVNRYERDNYPMWNRTHLIYKLVLSVIQDSHGGQHDYQDEVGGRYYAQHIAGWLNTISSSGDGDFISSEISMLDARQGGYVQKAPYPQGEDEEVLDEDENAILPHYMAKHWQTTNEDEEVFEDEDEDMVDGAKKKKGGFEGLGSLFG